VNNTMQHARGGGSISIFAISVTIIVEKIIAVAGGLSY